MCAAPWSFRPCRSRCREYPGLEVPLASASGQSMPQSRQKKSSASSKPRLKHSVLKQHGTGARDGARQTKVALFTANCLGPARRKYHTDTLIRRCGFQEKDTRGTAERAGETQAVRRAARERGTSYGYARTTTG